jgi:hypothetical protein
MTYYLHKGQDPNPPHVYTKLCTTARPLPSTPTESSDVQTNSER